MDGLSYTVGCSAVADSLLDVARGKSRISGKGVICINVCVWGGGALFSFFSIFS